MIQQAIIAQRIDTGRPDLSEIRALTNAAGAEVLEAVSQVRPEAPGTHFGEGKVAELAERVDATGADAVVVDGTLTPRQTVNLEDEVGVQVVDRHRIVLEIFADQARTREAQLQVKLARLKYRLPRVRERSDEGALNRYTESGTPYYDLLDRIDELDRQLAELPSAHERHRRQRREAGFDLVAITGYTNAGKSTLLRQLADEMSLDADHHADLDETAAVEDRLFKTLETTTRRATIDGRNVLVTDTVGFLDDLPHWLVESFRGTLEAAGSADAVILIVDGAQPIEELRRKLTTSLETLGGDRPPVIPVMNKIDRLELDERARKAQALRETVDDPILLSATQGTGLDDLQTRITETLPALERTNLELPMSDEAMSLLSWLHEEAAEIDVAYHSTSIKIEYAAKTATVSKARSRAESLGEVET